MSLPDQPAPGQTAIEHHFAKMAKRIADIERAKADAIAYEQEQRARAHRMAHIEPYSSPMQPVANKARAEIGAATGQSLRQRLAGWFKW